MRVLRELGAPWPAFARRGWEKFGDVAVLQFLAGVPLPKRRAVARIVAEELPARCVVEDVGGVAGELRQPRVRILFGSGTRTVHRENGLRFAMDVTKVMFASGNVAERSRAATLDCRGETVVDLFAGIGYFTIPLAARAGAARVVACEKNPAAFAFLEENVKLNKVEAKVAPLLGDCREVAPNGVADRVVLGYLGGTEKFLPTAVAALKPAGGVVHFHEAYPQETKFRDAYAALARAAGAEFDLEVLDAREVKSYAPGIDHVAVSARFFPRTPS